MGENSKISWTDHTFNPWMGCTKVSAGCHHCYAETLMDHRLKKVKWGNQGTRIRTSDKNWQQPLNWNRRAELAGIHQKVFCASLADVFEERDELFEWRYDLWKLISKTPNLIWMILTKRPENVLDFIPFNWGNSWPGNVWIGTSIEDDSVRQPRLDFLSNLPNAAIKFVSAEPLIGEIEFDPIDMDLIDWIIVGGESGKGFRPMQKKWVDIIFDACMNTGTSFFFKQWSGEYPKKLGRMYRGKIWNEVPDKPGRLICVECGKSKISDRGSLCRSCTIVKQNHIRRWIDE